MRDDDNRKWLTAARLIDLLQTLPSESRVMPNAVGNLLVLTPDGESSFAYIDLLFDGDVELLD